MKKGINLSKHLAFLFVVIKLCRLKSFGEVRFLRNTVM